MRLKVYIKKMSDYYFDNNRIIFDSRGYFDIADSLECGQTFRYAHHSNYSELMSRDKKAILYADGGRVIIESSDCGYFVRLLDLDRDYAPLNQRAAKFPELRERAALSKGIRLFNQDPFEVIISFIISANNNIPRIKKIIGKICEFCGEKIDGFYAFPTPKQLSHLCEKDFSDLGCGYRSRYLASTAAKLSDGYFIDNANTLAGSALRKELLTLFGVGGKVADCIMLFGFGRWESFPADTWIVKCYENEIGIREKAAVVSRIYSERYGDIAGLCQQYMFFTERGKSK